VRAALGWGRRSTWLVLLVVSTFARSGLAQSDSDRATARRIATAGVEAYERHDYALAVEKLEKAFDILKAPSVALWLARALRQNGQLVAAAERFAEAGRLPIDRGNAAVQAAAQRDAAAELEALTPQIPLLVVQVPGVSASELTLRVDGRALSSAVVGEQQPVDPGKHHIEVRRGEQLASADVELARGETKVATLSFTERSSGAAPASGEHPNRNAAPASVTPAASDDLTPASTGGLSRRTWGYAVAGAGVAGLVVGGVFGYLTVQAKQEQIDKCASSNACLDRSGASSAHDSAVTKGAVSTVAFIAGGLATTAGIVLIATDKSAGREAPGPKLSLVTNLGPSAANVRLHGEF
jgi:hypothetical protein